MPSGPAGPFCRRRAAVADPTSADQTGFVGSKMHFKGPNLAPKTSIDCPCHRCIGPVRFRRGGWLGSTIVTVGGVVIDRAIDLLNDEERNLRVGAPESDCGAGS